MAKSPRSGGPTRNRPTAPARPASTRASTSATAARAEADAPKKRTSPVQFANEVRAEARKITWTTWKETWITSVMVLIMVVLSAIFLFSVDTLLALGIRELLALPGRFS